ncbi:DsbA family protein [Agrobacterium sp. ES01]|uniref:DsbA family protein n=1 Tax=Agrobacterium sp. ES01 TaxID=3420714 RepID=UPI003D0FB4F9
MANLELTTTRRLLLGGIAVGALSVGLASCSDEKAPNALANASDSAKDGVDPVTTAATSSTEIPKSDRDVDMADVLKPGPLPEMTMGDENAPVKIVEYMSMTCPHCAHFHETTLEPIKTKYIDTGKVYFVIREFPFDPAATAAFMLARCAPEGQQLPFISMFMKQQRAWAAPSDGDVRGAMLQLSKLAGFTQESFEACLTNQKLAADVTAIRDRGAKDFGVNATPTFFINGKTYSGDMSVESMSALIDSML